MNPRSRLRLLGGVVPMLLTGGCASTGATVGSGVGETFLERAPYYAGRRLNPEDDGAVRMGHLPVAYQRGAPQPAIFDPAVTDATSELLERMTVYLDSLGVSVRLASGEGSSAASVGARGGRRPGRMRDRSGRHGRRLPGRRGGLGRGRTGPPDRAPRSSARSTAGVAGGAPRAGGTALGTSGAEGDLR